MRFATNYPDIIHGIVRLDKAEQPFIDDFESELLRLERIDQLGLVGQVFRSAKYPKLEHAFGLYHLIAANGASIPALKGKDTKSLLVVARRAALAHDFGHLPLTYATESGVAQAARRSPAVFEVLSSWVEEVRGLIGCAQCAKLPITSIVSYEPLRLHRWIGAWKLSQTRAAVANWSDRWALNDDQFASLLKALVCVHDPVATMLSRVDPMDYVPRDFLRSALGTFQINLGAAMRELGDEDTAETEFIKLTGKYLAQRLYGDPKVALIEGLVSKLVASLIVERKITLVQLTQMSDAQLESQLNAHGLEGIPTLAEIIGQVLDQEWFVIDAITAMPASAYQAIDEALGGVLHPFQVGIVAIAAPGANAGGLLYGNKKASLDGGVNRLLTCVNAPGQHEAHGQELSAWARPLALKCAVSLIAPGETPQIEASRLSPVLSEATESALASMETSPHAIVIQVVEAYDSHFPPADVAVDIQLKGIPIRSKRNRFVNECNTAIISHAIQPKADEWETLIRGMLLNNPQLLPTPLLEQIADNLRMIRDDVARDVSARAVAAELREFYLEHLECGENEWVFPPTGFFVGLGTAPLHETDSIRIKLNDAGPQIVVSEITMSDSEEKAMSDASKVARLVGIAHRRGVNVSLHRVSRTDMAPHRNLR